MQRPVICTMQPWRCITISPAVVVIHGSEGVGGNMTMMLVYFTDAELPDGRTVCRLGFPLLPDDIGRPAEFPTQILTTAADDGSDLARLAQYLNRPDLDNTEYGALADRVDLLLDAWQAKEQKVASEP